MIISILALCVTILGTAFGQFFYKRFFLTKKYINLGLMLACIGSVPLFSMIALRELSLDTVYIAVSLTIALTTFLAVLFLNETIQRRDVLAIGLIMCGVILYNLNVG